MKHLTLGLLAGWLLSGCIFAPKQVTYYDHKCQTFAKKSTLESTNHLANVGACNFSPDCSALLVAAGLVSAASVVVSGSITIIANTIYWVEKEKNCSPSNQPNTETHEKQTSIEEAESTIAV